MKRTAVPFVVLVLLWTICNLCISNRIYMIVLKPPVFIGTAYIFSKYIFKDGFRLKEEFKIPDKKAILKFLAGTLILLLVLVVSGYRTTGNLMSFSLNNLEVLAFISSVIVAPVTEEIYFRGFMRFAQIKDGQKASGTMFMIINCAAFVLIHYPKYIVNGTETIEIVMSSITLAMLSYLFMLIRNETDNLIFPILLHAFWNFGTILIL